MVLTQQRRARTGQLNCNRTGGTASIFCHHHCDHIKIRLMSLLMMTVMIAMTNATVMLKTIFHIGNDNDDDYCITMIKPLGHSIFSLKSTMTMTKTMITRMTSAMAMMKPVGYRSPQSSERRLVPLSIPAQRPQSDWKVQFKTPSEHIWTIGKYESVGAFII